MSDAGEPTAGPPLHQDDAGSAAESTSAPSALLHDPLTFREAARQVTAALLARVGVDAFDRVEDAVQEAFAAAARTWPVSGTPRQPLAWLHQVARRRYLDRVRADRRLTLDPDTVDSAVAAVDRAQATIDPMDDADAWATAPVRDDESLRLLFICCHPSLSPESRVALTLKSVAQLSVPEIARVLRADPTAVAQRLVRAKRTLREHRATFVMPEADALTERLDDVLAVAYALFSDGHFAADGDALIREEACREARRVVALLARDPLTATPAVHALDALLCFTVARMPARLHDGAAVPLAEQDRARWLRPLISQGIAAFSRSIGGRQVTRYHLEAEIALLHTTAPSYAATPWPQIVAAYDRLLALTPSPMTRLARVVALSEAGDLAAADAALAPLTSSLAAWPEVHAVAAELALRRADHVAARQAFDAALALPNAAPVRTYLERRRAACLATAGG